MTQVSALVLDTSALVAVALGESGSARLRAVLESATTRHISAVSKLEVGIVALHRGIADEMERLMDALGIETHPFDDAQCALATAAFARFGKGRHPAALNFGDCCSYALATSLDLPLLFTGDDLARTDLAWALN